MTTEEEKATISKFLRLTNGMRVKDVVEVVGEALENDHRTNQQSFWRFTLAMQRDTISGMRVPESSQNKLIQLRFIFPTFNLPTFFESRP